MDRLEAMSIVVQAADRGSLTAAAKALRLPLPTVSRKLGELERKLGARLFLRTTRSLTPTEAGEAYVAAARRILEEVDVAERTAAGEFAAPRGELVLTAPVLFARLHLLPIVAEFLDAYPEIDVRLIQSDRNLHLIEDHVDLAVRIGRLPDSGLIATRVGTMRQVVCASPAFLAAHVTPRSPADLGDLPCVTFDFGGPLSTWTFQAPTGRTPVETTIRSRLSVTTAEAAVWAAEQGIGVVRVLHYQCADALRRGSLRLLLEAYEPEPSPVTLVRPPHGAAPLKVRSFLDFAAPRLRRNLGQ